MYEMLEACAKSILQYVLYLNTERSSPNIEAISQSIEDDILRF